MQPFRLPMLLSFLWLIPCVAVHAGGAACVMAKFQGKTLDFELVVTKGHVVEAQE